MEEMSPQEQLEQLKLAFAYFDADGSGSIDTDELEALLDKLGLDDETANVEALFAIADADENGSISFEEFCAVVGSKVVPMSADPDPEMDLAWTVFTAGGHRVPDSTDAPATLTASSLHTVLQRLELGMTFLEAEEMVRAVEHHQGRVPTGTITLDEWKTFMREAFGIDGLTDAERRV